jgi:hypothetical protein
VSYLYPGGREGLKKNEVGTEVGSISLEMYEEKRSPKTCGNIMYNGLKPSPCSVRYISLRDIDLCGSCLLGVR